MTLVSTQARTAVYPGSFDLLTNGHLDIIERSQKLFDRLIVAVGSNATKASPLFSVEERLDVLREATDQWANVEAAELQGLTVEFAAAKKAQFIIRGLRAISDYEFELQLALMNHRLNKNIETIFLAADPTNIFVSSRVIRDVWRHGGDISEFVPTATLKALERKSKTA